MIASNELCSGLFSQEKTLLKKTSSARSLQEGQKAHPGCQVARNNDQPHHRERDGRLATPSQFKTHGADTARNHETRERCQFFWLPLGAGHLRHHHSFQRSISVQVPPHVAHFSIPSWVRTPDEWAEPQRRLENSFFSFYLREVRLKKKLPKHQKLGQTSTKSTKTNRASLTNFHFHVGIRKENDHLPLNFPHPQ